jgi:hypothetical protein
MEAPDPEWILAPYKFNLDYPVNVISLYRFIMIPD